MQLLSKFFNWFFGFFLKLANKSQLPKVKDINGEISKINAIRIIVGCITFARFAELAYISQFAEISTNYHLLLVFCGLVLLWTVGFLTPIHGILIICGASYLDEQVGSVTLGTAVLMQIMILLTISRGCGLRYSVDAYFLKNRPNGLIAKLYGLVGYPSKDWISVAYFLAFMSYAIISLVALSYHLVDPFWSKGYTFQVLSTSSYLCKYYEFFRWIEAAFPNFIRVFSILAILGQSLFQFFMIPLVFWKPGRYFVETWGWIFFLNSLVIIQLSYLPHIELALWWLIFVAPSIKDKIELQYSATGKRWKKLAGWIKSVSPGQSINISSSGSKEKLSVVVGETTLKGLDKIAFLVRSLLFSTLFYPINMVRAYIGKPSSEGAYIGKPDKLLTIGNKAIILLFVCMWLVYFPLRLPKVSEVFKNGICYTLNSPGLYSTIEKVILNFGLDCPVVFNYQDLSMADKWAVLYYLDSNDTRHRVPLINMDGSRENIFGWDYLWFSNHNCDKLYFGNTVKYRRGILTLKTLDDIKAWNAEGGLGNYILLYRAIILKKIYQIDSDRFIVEVYENHSSHVELPLEERYKTELLFEFPINVSGY